MVTVQEPKPWEDQGMVLQTAHEKPASVTHKALWDCVEQAWAGPFPTPRIYDNYLQKQTVICSACNYVSNRGNGDIRSHVERVQKQAMDHIGAHLSDPIQDAHSVVHRFCSGCDASFIGVASGMEHINRMNSGALSHGYVEALLVNQFALTCSELTVLGREVITEGPVTSQVAQLASPRKRRRRRGNKHGDRD